MGRPSFASTHTEPFTKDNGDEGKYQSITICPYCKRINTISYDLTTNEIISVSQCEHLQHYESITGHNCIFEFLKGGDDGL